MRACVRSSVLTFCGEAGKSAANLLPLPGLEPATKEALS